MGGRRGPAFGRSGAPGNRLCFAPPEKLSREAIASPPRDGGSLGYDGQKGLGPPGADGKTRKPVDCNHNKEQVLSKCARFGLCPRMPT